jgi:hypothetical protein
VLKLLTVGVESGMKRLYYRTPSGSCDEDGIIDGEGDMQVAF